MVLTPITGATTLLIAGRWPTSSVLGPGALGSFVRRATALGALPALLEPTKKKSGFG